MAKKKHVLGIALLLAALGTAKAVEISQAEWDAAKRDITKSIYVQQIGKPITTDGFYAALGYKMSESTCQDSCPGWLKPFEFLGRYQVFQNVLLADENDPTHTDIYRTQVVTGGINYYIKGHDAKIQFNYNWVFNPKVDNNPDLSFHNTKDDSFAVNFQVAF
jgi:hypothetical protein